MSKSEPQFISGHVREPFKGDPYYQVSISLEEIEKLKAVAEKHGYDRVTFIVAKSKKGTFYLKHDDFFLEGRQRKEAVGESKDQGGEKKPAYRQAQSSTRAANVSTTDDDQDDLPF